MYLGLTNSKSCSEVTFQFHEKLHTESSQSTDYNDVGIQMKHIPARDQNTREEQRDKEYCSRELTEKSTRNSQNPPVHWKETLKLNKEAGLRRSSLCRRAVFRLPTPWGQSYGGHFLQTLMLVLRPGGKALPFC